MRSATRTRLGLGLVAAAALTIAAVTPVAAGAPQVVGERHVEVVRDIPGFIDCGDFLIDYHVEVHRTITEFYGSEGNLIRAHFDIRYKGTLTNAETGLVARDDGSRMFIDDRHGSAHSSWPTTTPGASTGKPATSCASTVTRSPWSSGCRR